MISYLTRPGIVLPYRGAQRPLGPFTVNRDSPQYQGLAHWWPLTAHPTIASGAEAFFDRVGFEHGTVRDAALSFRSDVEVLGGPDFTENPLIQVGTLDVPNTAEFMAAAWFRADGHDAFRDERVFSKQTSPASNDHIFMMSTILSASTRVRFRLRNNDVTTTLIGPTTLNDGQLYHFAIWYDGTNMKIYLDGEEEATTGFTGAIDTSSSMKVSIGAGDDTGTFGQKWDGLITHVVMYDWAPPPSFMFNLWNPRTRWDLYYPLRHRVFVRAAAASVSITPTVGAAALMGVAPVVGLGIVVPTEVTP